MKKILLVEDNFDERMLVKRLFNKIDMNVELMTANDGQEAVDLLSKSANDDLPVFVLLDLKMPRMSGHEVLKWIRQNEATKCLPVIMFSCSDDEKDISYSYELGANSYVQKKVGKSPDLNLLSTYWTKVNKTKTS